MTSVTQLGYLGIGVSDLAAWERLPRKRSGYRIGHDADGTLFLKMDEYHHRFALHTPTAVTTSYMLAGKWRTNRRCRR